MTSPPVGVRRKRRRHLLVGIGVGFAIIALGATVALFGPSILKDQGFIEVSRELQTRNIVLTDAPENELGYEVDAYPGARQPAKPLGEGLEEQLPTSSGGIWPPDILPSIDPDGTIAKVDPVPGTARPRIEHLVLMVTYPGAVTIGDSIPIKVSISSQTLPEVRNGKIELTLECSALEWGSAGKGLRTVDEGEDLPYDVNFSAGTKATGDVVIVVHAKAPDPIVILTAAGSDTDTQERASMAPSMAAKSGPVKEAGAPGGAADTLDHAVASAAPVTARLNLDTTIGVTILTPYAVSQTTASWVGIGGWVVTAFGAGTILTTLGGFLKRRRANPDPLP